MRDCIGVEATAWLPTSMIRRGGSVCGLCVSRPPGGAVSVAWRSLPGLGGQRRYVSGRLERLVRSGASRPSSALGCASATLDSSHKRHTRWPMPYGTGPQPRNPRHPAATPQHRRPQDPGHTRPAIQPDLSALASRLPRLRTAVRIAPYCAHAPVLCTLIQHHERTVESDPAATCSRHCVGGGERALCLSPTGQRSRGAWLSGHARGTGKGGGCARNPRVRMRSPKRAHSFERLVMRTAVAPPVAPHILLDTPSATSCWQVWVSPLHPAGVFAGLLLVGTLGYRPPEAVQSAGLPPRATRVGRLAGLLP